MFFTRRSLETTGGKIAPDNDFFEDIYMATADTSHKFQKAVQMPGTINTKGHEGAIQLSTDNKKLYFYTKGKVFYTEFYSGVWLLPKEMTKKNDISDHKASEPNFYLSPTGDMLIFSSDRLGGYGGLDLYKSMKNADGTWGVPENLGALVNSDGDDDYPFMDITNSILYFSSKGHAGMGGYDIFKTTLTGGSTWSKPENMGYPLNSPADDITFVVTPSMSHGYFASNRAGSLGMFDIYRVSKLVK